MTAGPVAAALLLAGCQQSAGAQEQEASNAATTTTTSATASEDGPYSDIRPVRIGTAGSDLDACMTQAMVVAGGEASIFTEPSASSTEIERIAPETIVHICETSGDEAWHGVVYATEGDPYACDVGSPVAEPQDYAGPCQSGWIAADNVEVTAG